MFNKGSYEVVSLSNHLEVVGQSQPCWNFFRLGKEENALDPYIIDQLERVIHNQDVIEEADLICLSFYQRS